jgi:hypothetical protein
MKLFPISPEGLVVYLLSSEVLRPTELPRRNGFQEIFDTGSAEKFPQ